ncbi:MAG: tRNA (adenosine(37)-N6)-threonylcarbamoyltransferase complex dimerization subunit type 1 TsaB [Planctomycetes bacterium]|nr:tRNA (adenosine(37)-N6)-threonylcarbamoyltransferase complex dimerization subunit type 1 TsaB [Planctomycetota bacterium]
MSHLLAIETSHARGSVAIGPVAGSGEPSVELFPPGLVHARELHPAIDRLVRRRGLERTAITRIAVSQGPGSYTGIRVGVSAAKSLAWALTVGGSSCAAFGVSSLQAIGTGVARSFEARSSEMRSSEKSDAQRPSLPFEFAVLVDARRGSCYAARFRCEPNATLARLEDDHLAPVDRYLERLPASCWLVGSGARTLPGVERFAHLEETLDCPDASSIFRLGIEFARPPEDPHQLMPVYFRPSEAEERRDRDRRSS